MADNRRNGESLYLAWKLITGDAGAAGDARTLLVEGEGRQLYRLRSWAIVNGEARALVAPAASVELIAGAIWSDGDVPLQSRWVASPRACAAVAREIENLPVELGLAARPEQWPFSSAAGE